MEHVRTTHVSTPFLYFNHELMAESLENKIPVTNTIILSCTDRSFAMDCLSYMNSSDINS
jgi:hypothetical protein